MPRIRSENTGPELIIRRLLKKEGLKFKTGYKLKGKPDIIFSEHKTAVFIDGCFWHGCKKHRTFPQTRKNFWKEKINRNMQRDKDINRHYKKDGWKILRIWEHEIKKDAEKAAGKIVKFLK